MIDVNVAPRTSFFCFLFGHQFLTKQSVLLAEHGCPVCGGKRFVQTRTADGRDTLVPCEACKATGWRDGIEPEIIEETRRERRDRIRAIVNPKARRQERRGVVRIIKEACVRCGAANPNKLPSTPGLLGWIARLFLSPFRLVGAAWEWWRKQ